MIVVILIVLIILCILVLVTYRASKTEKIKFTTRRWKVPVDDDDVHTELQNIPRPVQNLPPADRVFFLNLADRHVRLIRHRIPIQPPNVHEIINNNIALAFEHFLNQAIPEEVFVLNMLDNFGINTEPLRETARETRLENAKKEAVTKEEAIDKYLDNTVVHTNNPQNVHDSAINANAAEIIKKLVESQKKLPTKDEIKDYFVKNFSNSTHFNDSMQILDILSPENTISSLNMMSDEQVLLLVWARSEENGPEMKEAIFDNLADCFDEMHNPVCVTGRAMRIIGSLRFIDHDPEMWKMQLTEDYQAEILEKTKNIIKEVASLAMDTDFLKYAVDYVDEPIRPRYIDFSKVDKLLKNTPASEENLIDIMKGAINDMIDTYAAEDADYKFPPHVLETIRKDNLAALN